MNTALQESDFAVVAAALKCWPDVPEADTALSTPARRLILAARAAAVAPATVGAADLAALLRHVLRADAEATGANNGLLVPADAPWPTAGEFAECGLDRTPGGVVFAQPWRPGWLGVGDQDPAAAAFRGRHAKPIGDEPRRRADPFLRGTVADYRSAGQREAIRTVLGAPATATIVGNLPTGSGKSLVAYLTSLVGAKTGTTIVVVPTTSLAVDQERAFREQVRDRVDRARFPAELAYHGGLPEADRALIKDRLAKGTQAILFTSPEALTSSLSAYAYAAAERGLISAFVIDEAHIVSQWGAEFRPAFQALAGTRNDLLRQATAADAPFRTILLSATLTEESLLTLQNLFGRPGPTEFISSVGLRCEPSYWLADARDEEERRAWVLDALRHLPRPLALYTTTVQDAKKWRDRLLAHGFRRLLLVAGETSANERATAIERLRDGTLDVVVATSAFGLGVDQPDLRAVVHACIPETIDRYYQEVGRGGRDGLPSVAVLASAPQDRRIADQLSRRRLISLERGFERWSLMHARAKELGEQRVQVPLWTAPPDLAGDNAENRAWNVRTLLLMDRGGLVEFEAEPPPRRQADESDEDWDARASQAFDDYASHAVLRIREGGLADTEIWDQAVGVARADAFSADREARRRMDRALQPAAKLCHLFSETYHLERALPGIPASQFPVVVARSCGGCPGCRAEERVPHRVLAPAPPLAVSPGRSWAEPIRPWFAGTAALAVLYTPADDWADDWAGDVARVLERLARLGLWCLHGPDDVLERPDVARLHRIAPHGAVFHLDRWGRLHAPKLPTALVHAPGDPVRAEELEGPGAPRIVIAPRDAADPRHPTNTIHQYHSAVTTAADIMERL